MAKAVEGVGTTPAGAKCWGAGATAGVEVVVVGAEVEAPVVDATGAQLPYLEVLLGPCLLLAWVLHPGVCSKGPLTHAVRRDGNHSWPLVLKRVCGYLLLFG